MADLSDGKQPALLLKDRPYSVGGRRFTLRLAMVAILSLKERWALKADADIALRIKRGETSDLVACFWAGAQAHHPKLTYDECKGLLDSASSADLASLARTVAQCAIVAWTSEEDEEVKKLVAAWEAEAASSVSTP